MEEGLNFSMMPVGIIKATNKIFKNYFNFEKRILYIYKYKTSLKLRVGLPKLK